MAGHLIGMITCSRGRFTSRGVEVVCLRVSVQDRGPGISTKHTGTYLVGHTGDRNLFREVDRAG